MERLSPKASRNHATYWAFVLHRLSGLGLALFLPLHFLLLGTALDGADRMNEYLRWTENPLVKFAEFGLVTLLALHLTGGLRLLAMELLPWSSGQKSRVAVATGLAFAAGLIFLLNLGVS